MAVLFDGDARIITEVGIGGDQTLDVVGIYSEWKQWVLAGNANFLQAFSVIGGDPIEGNISLGSTFFLENGWRLRPAELSHQLTIEGNLYVREGGNPFVPTLGSFNVLTQLRVSNLIDQVATGGGAGGVTLAQLQAELTARNVLASVLDAAISSRTDEATLIADILAALDTQGYTSIRAALLDNLASSGAPSTGSPS